MHQIPHTTSGDQITDTRLSDLPMIDYSIQVGAFSNWENAYGLTVNLRLRGIEAFYFLDIDKLYKVRFGDYSMQAKAKKVGSDLKKRGVIGEYYIVSPKKYFQDKAHSNIRNELIDTARRFLGTPYKYGGTNPETGVDCSGLVMTVYRLNGFKLPRVSREQFKVGKSISIAEIQSGDLVFFCTDGSGKISHVGIYAGQMTFIHAPKPGKDVSYGDLKNKYWLDRFAGVRRYLD